MNKNFNEEFKQQAVQALDDALVKICHVKVQHPEALGDILLQICQAYEKYHHNDDIIL